MRPIEIKDMIVGLIMIALFAFSIGKYDALMNFTKKEGVNALSGKTWKTPRFFPKGYEVDKRLWKSQ